MIRPFHFWCQKVVPLVYDNSLSYYEVLCKVADKLNEVIKQVNEQQSEIEININELFEAFEKQLTADVNNQIATGLANLDAKLEAMIKEQNAAVYELIRNVQTKWELQMDMQNCKVTTSIAAMTVYVTEQVQTLYKLLSSHSEFITSWVELEIDKLRKEIPEITSVQVVAPYNHEIVSIQECLDAMYQLLRCCALTCGEYDTSGITCGQYTLLGITCGQYDLEGRHYIPERLSIGHMHSPYTGKWVRISQVVGQLVAYHRPNALTAQEYADLNLTAKEYADYMLSAYSYDWDGKTILGA